MKYQSTRGGDVDLSFRDVVMRGYAPDDGMYMPMEIPKLTEEMLEAWSSLTFIELLKEIAKLFIGDEIPEEKISELIDTAYEKFDDPANPILVRSLKEDITLFEMFHGESMSFKDLSVCCAVQFLKYFLEESDTTAIQIIGTSGDTGSAVLHAMSGIDRVDIVVVLPKDRISEVQERQMTSVVSDNCHVIRADGTSDDLDLDTRKVLKDAELAAKHNLGCLNSVNWCRTMAQTAHHFYAYYQGKKADADKETVAFVPSGGLGNSVAGCVAREMGLPLRLVCAVTNDALYRAVYDSDYSISDVFASLASAINIQIIYNFEKIMYLLSDMDTALVKEVQEVYADGKATTPEVVVNKLKEFFEVVKVTDDELLAAIKKCEAENDGYIVCPHTATALEAAYRYENASNCNVVVYGVASPAKFTDVLEKAGVEWSGRNLKEELMAKDVRYTDWEKSDDWVQKLVELLDSIHQRRAA